MLLGVTMKMFAAVTFILDYHIWAFTTSVMGNLSVHSLIHIKVFTASLELAGILLACTIALRHQWMVSFCPCIFNVKDRMCCGL